MKHAGTLQWQQQYLFNLEALLTKPMALHELESIMCELVHFLATRITEKIHAERSLMEQQEFATHHEAPPSGG